MPACCRLFRTCGIRHSFHGEMAHQIQKKWNSCGQHWSRSALSNHGRRMGANAWSCQTSIGWPTKFALTAALSHHTKETMSPPPLVQGYEVVIGFETHAQLCTRSKIFSRASTAFGAAPNTQACAVDLALPGTLPVMNRQAVVCAIRLGLALGARIAPVSVFARKNYFYPDLPKGYQISQFELPVVQGGAVEFFLGNEKTSVRLVRAHLEEDARKL